MKRKKTGIIIIVISVIIGVAGIITNQYVKDNMFKNLWDCHFKYDEILTIIKATNIAFYVGIAGTVGGIVGLIVANSDSKKTNESYQQSKFIFCSKCGKKYNSENKSQFCDECGNKL